MAALYVVSKPSGAVRNPLGIRADKLGLCLPFTEGTGTPAQLGVRGIDDPTNWGTCTASGTSGATWGATDGGTYTFLRANNNKLLMGPTGAAALSLPRGTVAFVLTLDDVATDNQYIVGTGAAIATADSALTIRLMATSGPYLEVRHQTAGSTSTPLHKFTGVATATKYLLLVRWGYGAGFEAYCYKISDGTALTDTPANSPSSDTAAVVVAANTQVCIGNRPAGTSGNAASITAYGFNWWDWALSADEVNKLKSDIYNAYRTEAGAGYLDTPTGPICTRVTGTTADFSWVTPETLTGTVYLRVCYGTAAVVDGATVSGTTTASSADSKAAVQLTGLMAGTTYYYLAQYSLDNATWATFPCGRGRFVTQRASGEFKFAALTDDHLCLTNAIVANLNAGYAPYGDDIGRQLTAGNISGATAVRLYRIWRTIQDAEEQAVDFSVNMGDSWYTEALTSPTPRERMRAWRRALQKMFTECGCFYMALGNHEGEKGYAAQTLTGHARQQGINTDLRKKFFPMPDSDTYPEGGENEGAPAAPTDSATADYASNVGWLRDLAHGADGNPATWFGSYVYPFPAAGTHTARLGLNTSPLENYYAWTWGAALFIVLDPYRYTLPGTSYGSGFADIGAPWTLGTSQYSWLRGVLADSTASRKFVFMHHGPGGYSNLVAGEAWDGRGSGVQCYGDRIKDWTTYTIAPGIEHTTTDPIGTGIRKERQLHNLLKNAAVTAVFSGHDHNSSHLISETVNYVKPPGWAVDPFFGADWDHAYGDTYAQGGTIAEGFPSAAGVHGENGYALTTVGASDVTLVFRQTCLPTLATFTAYGKMIRYTGETIAAAAGDKTVTLPTTPKEVSLVCDEDDGDFAEHGASTTAGGDSWATINHYAAEFTGWGVSWYDQPYTSGVVSWSSGLDAATGVKVAYAPRPLYTATLANATPAEDAGTMAPPGVLDVLGSGPPVVGE